MNEPHVTLSLYVFFECKSNVHWDCPEEKTVDGAVHFCICPHHYEERR